MLQDGRSKVFALFVAEQISLIVVGWVLAYRLPANNFPYGISFLQKAGHICYFLAGIQAFFYLVYWCIYHKLYKGVKYAFIHARLVRKIRRSLLDAGNRYSTQEYVGEEITARLPRVKVVLSDDLTKGTAYIENTIRYHKIFDEMNISSALGRYIVLEKYLSDDMNQYIFEFETAGVKQLVFDDYIHFKNDCVRCQDYTLFLDAKNSVPLHHTLIVGSTGSGKTYALYSLILQLLNFSVVPDVSFADPKNSSLYTLGKQIAPENNAGSCDEIITLLERFYQSMCERETELGAYLEQKLDSDFRDWNLQAHIFIIDEFSSFMSVVGTMDKATRDSVNMCLTNIVQKGRQLGFFMWIIMQKSDSKILPTYLRDNLVFKVVLGQATDTTYQTAFEEYADLPNIKFQKGQGLYSFQGLTRQPKVCSFPTLNFDILASVHDCKK